MLLVFGILNEVCVPSGRYAGVFLTSQTFFHKHHKLLLKGLVTLLHPHPPPSSAETEAEAEEEEVFWSLIGGCLTLLKAASEEENIQLKRCWMKPSKNFNPATSVSSTLVK